MTVANSTISNAQVGISNNKGTVSVINCVLSGNSFARALQLCLRRF